MESLSKTDIAIVGGGIGGAIVANMLEKSGIDHLVIDPRSEYPEEFRCEKFNAEQIVLMKETGVEKSAFNAATPVSDVWMARFGRLVRKQNYPHFGFSYPTIVNALRDNFTDTNRFVQETVTKVTTSSQNQMIELSNGSRIEARLVVLASGANANLQEQLGFEKEVLSERHCLAIGFDVEPDSNSPFQFDTMTYWPEKTSEKMSYLTFFRNKEGWRANFFGYWSIRDERIKLMKTNPEECLHALMPGLKNLAGDFKVSGKLRVRPIDLYQWSANNQNGVVAIGDAWSSSCPGAGTGTTKTINDALHLCRTHIPEWLSTEGMDYRKINRFYEDPEKLRIDEESLSEAYKLRSLTMDRNLYWKVQRLGRFIYHSAKGRMAA